MNLTADLSQLIDQLEPIARPGGEGRTLMVMGAGPGAGASTVARELARLAAKRSERGVWLFDLEFTGNPQAAATRVRGQAYNAGFGREPFWSIQSGKGRARVVARESVVRNLFVTELQAEPGTEPRVIMRPAPDYWDAVRRSIDFAVVDAPGDTRAPLALSGDMDGVILVADGRSSQSAGFEARRQAIEARGGVVAGVIVNRWNGARSAA